MAWHNLVLAYENYYSERNIPSHCRPGIKMFTKTTHREFKSRWLESVIVEYCKFRGYKAKKIKTTGKYVIKKQNFDCAFYGKVEVLKAGWQKNDQAKKGTPDIEVEFDHGIVVLWEVKIGSDRLSPEQKEYISETKKQVYICKTLDDFLEQFYEIYIKIKKLIW